MTAASEVVVEAGNRGRSSRVGTGYGLVSPVFQALVPILISAGLRGGSGAMPLLAVRTAIAAGGAWVILSLSRNGASRLRAAWARDPVLVAGGFAGCTAGPFVGYIALERIDPTAYISIYYLHVPLVALAAPLLGLEHASRRALAAAVVSFIGAVLAAGGADQTAGVLGDPVGLACSLGAALGTFFLALALHRAGPHIDATRLNAEFMTVGGLIFVAWLTVRGSWDTVDARALYIGAAIALLAWLPGRLFWSLAVREIGARAAGIFGSLQPGLVALLSAALLHDHIGLDRWLGIALLSGGVVALMLARTRTPLETSDV